MTRIAATEEQTFRLPISQAKAYAFFSQPQIFSLAIDGLQKCEPQSDGTVHWVFEEKNDSGIRFQPDYVVRFESDGQSWASWKSVSGNMGNDGEVRIRALADGGCEVMYRETAEPDLPITQLMARLIKPIVTRELRRDVGRFLERARQMLQGSNVLAAELSV